jgi:hypothetical protein
LDATLDDDFDEITRTQAPDQGLLRKAGAVERAPGSGITARRHRTSPEPVCLLGMDVLRALLRRFTDDAGPAARPLMLREIASLGAAPETFPLLLAWQLIAALGQRLDDHATRRRFVEDADQILKTMT